MAQWCIGPRGLAPLSAPLRLRARGFTRDRRHDRRLSPYRATSMTALVADIFRAVRELAPCQPGASAPAGVTNLFLREPLQHNCFQDWSRWRRHGVSDCGLLMG